MNTIWRLAVVVALLGRLALSQSPNATIAGRVTDPSNAVITDARIDAISLSTNIHYSNQTTSEGSFVIPNLPPGPYRIEVTKAGFKTVVREDVVLHVQDIVALNFTLPVGAMTESITVTGGAPLVNTESGTVSTVVDQHFVENMPLNGRSFQQLITLTPGVVLAKTSFGEQGQFSINGQRADANYFTIDGVSANIGVSGGVSMLQSGGSLPALSAAGGTNTLVSVDAMEEFRIQTSSYSPEFGRSPGGQISVVTRSGTNQLHGSLFEYFRNDLLDANDWFANRAGLPKPPLRQNDFGGVIGGPIVPNRTFFFFSYEGLRLRQPKVTTKIVPSLNGRTTAPPEMQPFLNAFPIPNGADLGGELAEFSASYSNPSSLNAVSLRLDHRLGEKLSLFGRYNYAPSENLERGTSTNSLSTIGKTKFRTQTLTVGATALLTPAVSNDFRFNYSLQEAGSAASLDNFGGATVVADSALFPTPFNHDNALFSLDLGGLGYTVGKNVSNEQRQFNAVDGLAVAVGPHQLKFGADYRRTSPTYGPREYEQDAFFGGMGDSATPGTALSGTAQFVSITARDLVGITFQNFSAYAQDSWKLLPRLSLTYGLRWEINPPPSGNDGKELLTVTGVNDPSTAALAPSGTPLFETTYSNFAPRVGFAYQISTKAGLETVLRGGLGIFHDLISGSLSNAASSSPYVRSTFVLPIPTPFPVDPNSSAPPPFTPAPPPPFSMTTTVPNLKVPRTTQWNAALEQSLGSNQHVTLSYIGATGRQLLRQDLLQSSGNPNFSTISLFTNGATSDYHAMQLQFQRRMSQGLQMLASYTWAHSIDNASNNSQTNTPAQNIDPTLDRGSSDFDVRHSVSAAVSYTIPNVVRHGVGKAILGGWSLQSIVGARSAAPINVVVIRNLGPNVGFIQSRPDVVSGVPLFLNDPAAPGGKRINDTPVTTLPGDPVQIGPFVIPLDPRQGTLPRNALRGFAYWQLDFAVRRNFNLTERLNLQFRTEFFNLFNHPNFGDQAPSPGCGTSCLGIGLGTFLIPNPLFGSSTSMLASSLGSGGVSGGFNPLYQVGGPRSIQFALRLQF